MGDSESPTSFFRRINPPPTNWSKWFPECNTPSLKPPFKCKGNEEDIHNYGHWTQPVQYSSCNITLVDIHWSFSATTLTAAIGFGTMNPQSSTVFHTRSRCVIPYNQEIRQRRRMSPEKQIGETFPIGLANWLAPISEFEFGSDGFFGVRKSACSAGMACLQIQQALPL
ncbi:hypothetical protein C8J57DRAFT_1249110 [Mycena rebaudengoi]|nr:hypothetical protein C8J57DRAFT_1249110 [Mycena rebaudengoi]